MSELSARIDEYFGNGGLFNPELMDHAKVRDLLVDVRAHLTTLAAENARLRAVIDHTQDHLAAMNRSGEISDDTYEKFYEGIPHEMYEAWLTARATTPEIK